MVDDIDGLPFSTQFSFTRFAIPLIDKTDEWVLFCDADFLFRADVAELFALAERDKYLMCVHHDYSPLETTKFDGMQQQRYQRKNWSSLMLMRPARLKITNHELNNWRGIFLHCFDFMDDRHIGELPIEWNWLEGWSPNTIKPKAIHYTRGTPDMLGSLPYDNEWWLAVKSWVPSDSKYGVFPCE